MVFIFDNSINKTLFAIHPKNISSPGNTYMKNIFAKHITCDLLLHFCKKNQL